jgi:hypothetical protein
MSRYRFGVTGLRQQGECVREGYHRREIAIYVCDNLRLCQVVRPGLRMRIHRAAVFRVLLSGLSSSLIVKE